MKKLSNSFVSLDVQAFYIKSGEFEKEILTGSEPYSLLEICLFTGASKSEIENFELVEKFEIQITDDSIIIEGELDAKDIELKSSENTEVIMVLKNKSNEYLICFSDNVTIYSEDFVGWLNNKHVDITINQETNIITRSLEFEPKEFDLNEDDEEIIQIRFRVLHDYQGIIELPYDPTLYRIDHFKSITFNGFISDIVEERLIQKAIYPTGRSNIVGLYHNTNDNEITIIIN